MPDLNKPAVWYGTGSDSRSGSPRSPRWYLWEGGYFVMGQAGGEVPPHAHHAIQIFVSIDGHGAFRVAGGEWQQAR
jgi:hypothetical protein